ncbi:unnamed protein product, partial [Prorocentrum cordatum]
GQRQNLAGCTFGGVEGLSTIEVTGDQLSARRRAQALVDPGAGNDLEGIETLNQQSQALARQEARLELIPKNLQRPQAARGVGGPARVVCSILFPFCMAGVLGIVETTVLKDDVPHILGVNLLDFLALVIDLPMNQAFFADAGDRSCLLAAGLGPPRGDDRSGAGRRTARLSPAPQSFSWRRGHQVSHRHRFAVEFRARQASERP